MQKESKRLVKNKLSSIEWDIINYLKDNHVGYENAITGSELSNIFNVARVTLRHYIRNIRKHHDLIIGSDIEKGYYIPLQVEKDQALQYAENKTLSELETRVRQNPIFALKAYKKLNETLKTVDKAQQGQFKMKLSGYENETVNYFGDKYRDVKFKIGDKVNLIGYDTIREIVGYQVLHTGKLVYYVKDHAFHWHYDELELVEE